MAVAVDEDWGLQQEYDSNGTSTLRPVAYGSFDDPNAKVFGEDIDSFSIGSDGIVFVVSSELGGNLWQGYVGVYNDWSYASTNLAKPLAHFVDSTSTYSCSERLNDATILCGADKGTIELFRFTVSEYPDVRIFKTLIGHDDVVGSVRLSADMSHVISGSFDHTSKSWDLDSGTCVSTFDASNHPILSVMTSPIDPNLYCAASRDGSVYLIDSRLCSGVAPSILKSPHFEMSNGVYPTALAWPESLPETVYVGYSDGSLVRFDTRKHDMNGNGSPMAEEYMHRPHQRAVTCLDASTENCVILASGGEDGNICISSFTHGEKQLHSVVGKHAGSVRCVRWSETSRELIYSAGWDGKLRSFSSSSPHTSGH